MTEVLKAGVLSDEIDLGALAHNAAEQAEEFVRKVTININIYSNTVVIRICLCTKQLQKVSYNN